MDAAADEVLIVVEPGTDGRAQSEFVGDHRPDDGVDELQRFEGEVPVGRAFHFHDEAGALKELLEPAVGDPGRGKTERAGVGDCQFGSLADIAILGEE